MSGRSNGKAKHPAIDETWTKLSREARAAIEVSNQLKN
jgi:hypothetical protein